MKPPGQPAGSPRRLKRLFQVAILSLILLGMICPPQARADLSQGRELKIGVLAKRGHELALKRWSATANYLNNKLPKHHFRVVPLDFNHVQLAVMSGEIDFLITNSSYYVSLELVYDLKPIATLKNLHRNATQQRFGGVIFTLADRNEINTLADVRGKTFVAVDEESLGGWLAAWREFYEQKISPSRDFALLRFVGTHDAVVTAILEGQADVGTVRSDTLEQMADENLIRLEDVKILNRQTRYPDFNYALSTRLYPEWPFAALKQVDPELIQAVSQALLEMPASSPAAQTAQIAGWSPPLDYQPIHDLLQERYLCLYESHFGKPSFGVLLRKYWPAALVVCAALMLLIFVALYNSIINRRLETLIKERTRELERESEERRQAERKLQQAEKMKLIGLMASGVAHDLNNILSGIVSYPELLLMRLPEGSNLEKPLNVIRQAGRRAVDIVADLLTISRDAAKVSQITNLNTLILEHMASPEAMKIKDLYPRVAVKLKLRDGPVPINCSPTHIKKSIMNLILNAAEAIAAADGAIIIRTGILELDEPAARAKDLNQGPYARVEIEDNGPGIRPEDLDHIFEPFYTKKELGRSGTGIGLTVVWNTIHDHNGHIAVTSSPEGTCFTLLFPLVESELTEQTPGNLLQRPSEQCRLGQGEKILVVDDETTQRRIAVEILKECGYDAMAVESGEKAVDYLRQQKVDLLVLDMQMSPGIDGLETYIRVKSLCPDQKALIASGYSEHGKIKKALELGVGGFIKKPFTIEELIKPVHDLLHKGKEPNE